jgi:hypothetical protein
VRVDNPLQNTKNDNTIEEEGCYVWGISEAFEASIGDGERKPEIMEHSDVSRAYFKLEEAFGRYKDKEVLEKFLETGPSLALDCGAAPGGWTKYLLDESLCSKVWSVDPGKLAPIVSTMQGVQHLPMKLEDALPQLVGEGVKMDVYVSDMCLHYLSSQVDFLLESRPVLRDNAFFVMTLKCIVGFTKASHDQQVETQVERLKPFATGITVIHLFSNRRGERTVMGFLKSNDAMGNE